MKNSYFSPEHGQILVSNWMLLWERGKIIPGESFPFISEKLKVCDGRMSWLHSALLEKYTNFLA